MKKKIREVIVVEGRYDKNTLSQVVDAVIVETGRLLRGFITKKRSTICAISRVSAG